MSNFDSNVFFTCINIKRWHRIFWSPLDKCDKNPARNPLQQLMRPDSWKSALSLGIWLSCVEVKTCPTRVNSKRRLRSRKSIIRCNIVKLRDYDPPRHSIVCVLKPDDGDTQPRSTWNTRRLAGLVFPSAKTGENLKGIIRYIPSCRTRSWILWQKICA